MTTTREKLGRIPDLAAEVWLTRDAPNPGGDSGRHVQPTYGSRPPINLAMFDALRPIDPDLATETAGKWLCNAVRIAWKIMWANGVELDPYPIAQQPTYASESAWLLATVDLWERWEQVTFHGELELAGRTIGDEINNCYNELSRLAREPRPVRMRCPQCSAILRAQPGGEWLFCDSGHAVNGGRKLASEYWNKPAMKTEAIAKELGIQPGTLRQWKNRGKIQPEYSDGKDDWWRPREVLMVKFPELRESFDVLLDGGASA